MLGVDRWKALCTEMVILNEGRRRRKWIWSRGIGKSKPGRWNYPQEN